MHAQNAANKGEQVWAIGMAYRTAALPYATQSDDRTQGLVPLLFYRGDKFFFRGLEGGYSFYKDDLIRFSAIGRVRFLDIPVEYQNQVQGDDVHWGVQARFSPVWATFADVEVMTSWNGRLSSNFRAGLEDFGRKLDYQVFGEIKLKTKNYNSYYYGLTAVDISGGSELAVGAFGKFHVISNLYLFGQAKLTFLEKNVRKSEFVKNKPVGEIFAGFGFSNDKDQSLKPALRQNAYIRLAHGWATPSSLNNILHGRTKPDPYNNQLTSVFYGHPLTDQLFGAPLDIYLHSGFIWHWASKVQDHEQELVLSMKFYYTVPWPIRWKIGAAEGWSWVTNVPYMETANIEKHNYEPSNLLNYLDFSIDFNIGDIVGGEQMKRLWLGYSIHHRSGIFETAQLFGRIKGGSNYNTVYLQYHFD
jgi:outer membrane protein